MAAKRSNSTPAPAGEGADRRVLLLTRQLGALLAELGLSEVEVESGDLRVRVHRVLAPAAAVAGAAHPAALAPLPTPAEHPVVADVTPNSLVTIESPMVGTFYRASSPTADPYVREGDVVKEGQILCIIEAM